MIASAAPQRADKSALEPGPPSDPGFPFMVYDSAFTSHISQTCSIRERGIPNGNRGRRALVVSTYAEPVASVPANRGFPSIA